MATQTIEVEAIENETGTVLRAFQVGSDTEQANQSATEATNRKGCYVASFTDLPAAVYRFQLDDSAGVPLCVQYQNITDQTATFQAYESYSAGASTSEIADAVWDEAGNAHNTGNTFGHYINQIRKSSFTVEGQVSGGTPTTTTFQTNVSNDNNAYNDQLLLFTSGNLEGEARPIESYTQTNGVIVVQQAFTQAPADTDEFVVLPAHEFSLAEIADEVLKRSVSNVEATADQHSLATIILCLLESSRSSTTWTIKRTDGTTTHATKTLTLDATANPVIGVD